MLETQIEKLTERVGAVELKQDRTNELLGAILSALREGGTTPPQPAQVAEVKAKATPKKSKKPEEPIAVVEAVPDNSNDEVSYTFADVCESYKHVKEQYSKQVATDIVKRIAGDVANVMKIPESKFPAIIAALESYNQEGAA